MKNLKKIIFTLTVTLPITAFGVEVGEKPMNSVPGFYSSSSTLRIPLLKSYDSATADGSVLYSTDIEIKGDFCTVKSFQAVPREADKIWHDKGFDTALSTELEHFLDKLIENAGQPSAALLVEVDDKVWHGVRGARRTNKPEQLRTFDDSFRAGSVTKAFTGSLIMQLVDEERVNLNDTIDKWFSSASWFKGMPNNSQITVEHLLNHQSGLYNYTSADEFKVVDDNPLHEVHAPEDWLEISFGHSESPLFDPGEDFNYTNTGYTLLGLLIEKELGISYEDAIRKRVLEPLNLTRTTIPEDPSIPYPYTHGHSLVPDKINITDDNKLNYDNVSPLRGQLTRIDTYLDPSIAWSAGAVISNMYDLNTFIKAYVNGSLWANSETTEKLLDIEYGEKGRFEIGDGTWFFNGPNGAFYMSGNGIQHYRIPDNVSGDKYWGHYGQIPGYETAVFYDPDNKISFVISSGSYDRAIAPTPRTINWNSLELLKILHQWNNPAVNLSSPVSSNENCDACLPIQDGQILQKILYYSGF